jgi:pyruvate-ferredoxin/flavodoxin oxidoreductase
VVNAVHESWSQAGATPRIVGGRYGLSSKEFTPAMVKATLDNLAAERPKNHFTVGIHDDLSHTSLDSDPAFSIEPDDVFRALFYGLGADGTVGANKNSIHIIGEQTSNYAQGYFVYDSKKSGAVTVSHLRVGPRPIRSTYLVTKAHFIGCHQPVFVERYDMLQYLLPGGTFLLNTPYGPEEIWNHLPQTMREQLIEKKARLYVIDANKVARDSGMGGRINTVMQVCFFGISGVLPHDEAIAAIKESIRKTYGKKGEEIVQMNLAAVDQTLAHLHKAPVPSELGSVSGHGNGRYPLPEYAPPFVRDVLQPIIAGYGDNLPVSALPCDGTFPTGTAQFEKRNIATEIPVWDPVTCIQCGKCAMVCPHAVIRIKAYEPTCLEAAPPTFKACDAKDRDWHGLKYTIQVAPSPCRLDVPVPAL